jgi:transcriptional regulator
MYIPKAFREDDLETLYALMRNYNFATLITTQNGVPLASHLPFLLDTQRGPYGTLMAHMARANPQWQTFDSTQEALVIFQGPHAYISPSWYEDDVEQSVPTWNYAVVHAYGTPYLIEDTARLYNILQATVQTFEGHFERPWELQPLNGFMQNKMRGIVGFEIPITRLEGKFKLNQNRSENDQVQVADVLKSSADDLSAGVAQLMSKRKN